MDTSPAPMLTRPPELPPVLKCREPWALDTPPSLVDWSEGGPRPVKVHELKTWTEHFAAVWEGAKRAELRHDDRGFEVGHALWLRETDPLWCDLPGHEQQYLGRAILARITHKVTADEIDDLVSEHIERGSVPFAMLSLQIEGRYTL